ncbi:NADH:flavin oxidoreductase [Martelella radicis]|uniref:2,4-dienoyl-CoA reductase-like NADH-dependent reductase (Old Yellow Enzyme family) n=1 Tax=Martelella radicis TaxID=1397476 RepID=A0A7W6KMV9_9HYPH|nr:NADH:flavin oxidoreductase [Martelella radicis]MBB4124228.1 2,4-dienoyl-CoA reductase-like NADH-dependent reductase (Old Yellow Enzyme family) [Martelella radicis]
MPSSATQTLFRPFKFKSLELKNRIVMAPMTRTFSPEGVPGDNVAAYYRRRAENDVGLILSEGTVIDRPTSKNHPAIPDFHGEKALSGWKNVIDSVHAANGKMGPQIWHVANTVAHPEWPKAEDTESPSGFVKPGEKRGRAMSEEDIADTISAFAKAAADAERLGFDVVELHGAHGYLIDQFFWPELNLREDRWGGPAIAERARFAAEVIKAVRESVSDDMPVIIRLSQWKQQDYNARIATTPAEMAEWLEPLVDAGADILHCSQRRFWEPEFPEIDGENGLNFAGWAKKITGVPTISVGSVGLDGADFLGSFGGAETSASASGIAKLVNRMEKDEFDLIAVGRALIKDPEWVKKVEAGEIDKLQAFSRETLAELV